MREERLIFPLENLTSEPLIYRTDDERPTGAERGEGGSSRLFNSNAQWSLLLLLLFKFVLLVKCRSHVAHVLHVRPSVVGEVTHFIT